ncbi:MAG TPA: polymorphic toxin type 23 domain-containing protein [Bacteroidia bacterium]|jgi:RHS repeat-associated protein
MKHVIFLIVYIVSVSNYVFSQNIITLNAPETGTKEYKAKQRIDVQNGYHYSAAGSNSLHLFIDPNDIAIDDVAFYEAYYNTSLFSTRVLNQTLVVGTTPGSASVGGDGSSNYNVPISIPKGTGGVEPSVSLNYNSRNPNGILGMGWTIGGLSVISRMRQSLYHDNSNSPITYSPSDRFSLDGSRLICTSGTYGANNAIYSTEIESFSKITSFGISPYGPERFTVETKNGLVMEYGSNPYAKISTPDGKTLMWFLNKVYDKNGNYIEYKYKKINDNIAIDKILYTGNENSSLEPYNVIQFEYALRADSNALYQCGQKIYDNLLIKRIKVLTKNQIYRDYEFKYANSGSGSAQTNFLFSHLKEIIEKGNSTDHYNSTIFKYVNLALPFGSTQTPNFFSHPLNSEYITSDFNSDGTNDFIEISAVGGSSPGTGYYSPGSIIAYQNDHFANFHPITAPFTLPTGQQVQASDFYPYNKSATGHSMVSSDFNGDGFEDLCFLTKSGATVSCYAIINTTTSCGGAIQFALPQLLTQFVYTGSDETVMRVGDFDGDSKSDIMIAHLYGTSSSTTRYLPVTNVPVTTKYYQSANVRVFLNGNFASVASSDYFSYSSTSQYISFKNIYPVDLNNDGRTELLGAENRSREFYNLQISASSALTQATLVPEPKLPISTDLYVSEPDFKCMGDFNGDGNADIMYGVSSGTDFTYYIAYGGGNYGLSGGYLFFNKEITHLGFSLPSTTNQFTQTSSNSAHLAVDVNSDGKTDIIEFKSSVPASFAYVAQDLRVFVSTGIDFFEKDYVLGSTSLVGNDTRFNFGDFNGDGGLELFLSRVRNTSNILQPAHNSIYDFQLSPNRQLLDGVANGLNQRTYFNYKNINVTGSETPYSPQANAVFPIMDFMGSMYVVNKISTNNGTNDFSTPGTNDLYYFYEGAKIHRQGKGFLGFMKTSITEGPGPFGLKKRVKSNRFDLSSYLILPQDEEEIAMDDNSVIASSQHTTTAVHLGSKRYLVQTNSSVDINFATDAMKSVAITYDIFGNITQQEENTYKGILFLATLLESKTINTTYGHFGTWLPSSPTQIVMTHSRVGEVPITKGTNNVFDGLGRILQSVEFAGQPKSLTSTYTYDIYGNVLTSTVQTPGMASRGTQFTYDDEGRFVKQTKNPLNQITETTTHSVWDSPIKIKGVDGLETTYEYNSLGRLIKTISADGIAAESIVDWALTGGVPNSTFYTWLKHPTQPDKKVWYTYGGIPVKTSVEDFNQNIITKTKYFPNGVVAQTEGPSNGLLPGITTLIEYDKYKRITKKSNSIGNTLYNYSVLNGETTTTITLPSGESKSQTFDASGKLVKVSDNAGDILYNYTSDGNTKSINTLGITTSTMEYDNMGQQSKLTDLNAGITLYDYNGFGELISQTNANSATYNMQYDQMGRVVQRSGPDGTTTYSYVTTGNGKNAIKKIIAANGTTQEFTYDPLGRTKSFTESISGQAFTTSYNYNSNNNLSEVTYPSGFKILKEYDSNSILTKIKDASTSQIIYELQGINEYQQVTNFIYGNGINTQRTFDAYGNLNHIIAETGAGILIQDYEIDPNLQTGNINLRRDNIRNLTENFTYDNLNRLTSTHVIGQPYIDINYSPNGNITSKSDVGTYTYDATKTNAVVNVSHPDPNLGFFTQTSSYTPFNKLEQIIDGDYELNLIYGADYERVKTELKYQGTLVYTRYYTSGYEKTVTSSSTQELHYINCGGGLGAIYVIENGNAHTYYIHKDHLGSITEITDDAGNVIAEQNFDAWGNPRNPANWSYSSSVANPDWVYRGFTGHEHLNEFALINMNGRCYDPLIARMLSPDNYVQEPENSQSFNRYSYVVNNPVRYTDPSGYWWGYDDLAVAAAGFVIGYASYCIKNNDVSTRGIWAGVVGAGMAWLGYNTMGGGAAVGAYVASMIGNAAVSIIAPPVTIASYNNYTVSASMGAFSPAGFSPSIDASIQYTGQLDNGYYVSVGADISASTGKFSEVTKLPGQSIKAVAQVEVGKDDFGIIVRSTNFAESSETSQRIGGVGFRAGEFSLVTENDMFKGTGDGQDRYRTASLQVSYKEYSAGLKLITGNPNSNKNHYRYIIGSNEPTNDLSCKDTYCEGNPYRLGAVYIGYKNYQIGVSHEGIRNFVQNRAIHTHVSNSPWFEYINYSPSLYYYDKATPHSPW